MSGHPISWTSSLLPSKLGSNYKGPVAPLDSVRLQATASVPKRKPQAITLLRHREVLPSRRNPEHAEETGNLRIPKASKRRGVPLPTLASTKERRGSATHNKPQEAKRLREDGALQNGRHTHVKRPAEARRLDGKGGHEGCIFHDPNSHGRPGIPPVRLGGQIIPIQLSSIRSVLRPMGLYQDHEASSGPTQRARPQTDHIHRRHPAYGRVGDPTPRPHDGVNLPPREPGVCHQLEEISAHSNERVRIPRVHSELPFHGDEASRREAEENQIRSQAAPFREPSDSPNAFAISGQIECSHQCHSSGSTFLPKPPEKPPRSARSGRAELLSECRPHTGSSRGASMVGGASNQVEWAEPRHSQTIPNDRNGYLTLRMGSDMSGRQDGRSMVQTRERAPHQLPGASRSNTGCQMLCQEAEEPVHLAEDGQHNGHCLHQSAGGNNITRTQSPCQRVMAVVSGEGHILDHPTPPGCPEHNCGRRIPSYEGQVGLDNLPLRLPGNLSEVRPTGSGPLCLSLNSTVATICQLETRPRGDGDGCLLDGLVPITRLCHSTMEPSGESPRTSLPSTSQTGPNSSSMESTTMVCSSTRNAHRDTDIDCRQDGPDPGNSRGQPSGHHTSASRVGFLRERYRSHQLSEKATELLLAFWRQKSSKTYDSLFRKCIGWCNQRDSDPVSGQPTRSADLSQLNLRFRRFLPEGVAFAPAELAKQSRQTKPLTEFFFPAFPSNPLLCPVNALKEYETDGLRGDDAGLKKLFLATIKLHNLVTSSTIARWLRVMLERAGVNTEVFKAHSVRAASASAAAGTGLTTNDILNAADWSTESVFRKFYYKPAHNPCFGETVLSSGKETL